MINEPQEPLTQLVDVPHHFALEEGHPVIQVASKS